MWPVPAPRLCLLPPACGSRVSPHWGVCPGFCLLPQGARQGFGLRLDEAHEGQAAVAAAQDSRAGAVPRFAPAICIPERGPIDIGWGRLWGSQMHQEPRLCKIAGRVCAPVLGTGPGSSTSGGSRRGERWALPRAPWRLSESPPLTDPPPVPAHAPRGAGPHQGRHQYRCPQPPGAPPAPCLGCSFQTANQPRQPDEGDIWLETVAKSLLFHP